MFEAWKWRARIDQIQRFLDQERTMLLDGEIDLIVEAAPRRERAERALSGMPANVAETQANALMRLRDTSARNRRLLEAYLSGARSAASHLTELEKIAGQLGAYTRD
ncbi:MAG: hypothetical protein AAF317_15310, partial [Pseudomonadota bacterium]